MWTRRFEVEVTTCTFPTSPEPGAVILLQILGRHVGEDVELVVAERGDRVEFRYFNHSDLAQVGQTGAIAPAAVGGVIDEDHLARHAGLGVRSALELEGAGAEGLLRERGVVDRLAVLLEPAGRQELEGE